MITINSYECEYGCGFYRNTPKSVEAHEKKCLFNPESRSCITCIFFRPGIHNNCIANIELKDGKLNTQCLRYCNGCEDYAKRIRAYNSKAIDSHLHPLYR